MPFSSNQDITVLVIDNEAATLLTTKAMLEYSGFKAETAKTESELGSILGTMTPEEPHFVIIEHSMIEPAPTLCAEIIRKHNPQAVFILGHSREIQPDQTLLGVLKPDGFIHKPYSVHVLADTIQALYEKA